MTKLVAVTVFANGRKIQIFTRGEVQPDGKVTVSTKTINLCCRALGVTERGQTYSVG